MKRAIALITSNPRLVEPLLRDQAALDRLALEIPLAIRIRPSMALRDRLRDLARALRRQARINRTTPAAQCLHHFVYRWRSRWRDEPGVTEAEALLAGSRMLVECRSANDARAVEALRRPTLSLAVVVGADPLSRRTLDAIPVPLWNVHFGDPAFARGRPIAFWEILGGRSSILVTLHRLVLALDAGEIAAQHEVEIDWRPTLAETIGRTRLRAATAVAGLIREAVPRILEGGLRRPRPGGTGPLRTTPTTGQILAAERICRRRADAGRS